MSKIVIKSDIHDACMYVQKVINMGKISGENKDCYCYVSIFKDGVYVSCDKTKTCFIFNVWIPDDNI